MTLEKLQLKNPEVTVRILIIELRNEKVKRFTANVNWENTDKFSYKNFLECENVRKKDM